MADLVWRNDEKDHICDAPSHFTRARRDGIVDGPLARHVTAKRHARRRSNLLAEVRELTRRLGEATGTADGICRALAAKVDELVSCGLPPSDRNLRELLRPIIGRLPKLPDSPNGFRSDLEAIRRFVAIRPLKESKSARRPMPEIEMVATRLRDRSMVVIGGNKRQKSADALKVAFQLKDVIWMSTKKHESVSHFEPRIARPDVAIVVLLIRLSSHSFGGVREFCERYAKPLVRLPGGYNKNTVASEIMAQCSKRL